MPSMGHPRSCTRTKTESCNQVNTTSSIHHRPRSMWKMASTARIKGNLQTKVTQKKTMTGSSVSQAREEIIHPTKIMPTNSSNNNKGRSRTICTNQGRTSTKNTNRKTMGTQAVSYQVSILESSMCKEKPRTSLSRMSSNMKTRCSLEQEKNLSCMTSSRVNTTIETWEVTSKQQTTAAGSLVARTQATSTARWARLFLQSIIIATTSRETWSTTPTTSTQ